MQYGQMTREQREQEYLHIKKQYDELCAMGLSLNLARGKPSSEQLDLSNDMLHTLDDGNFVSDGNDVRNYGCLDGLPACKRLFAELLGVRRKRWSWVATPV